VDHSDPATYQHVIAERRGPVEYLTLNRPEVRNAFNEHVITELTAWAAAARDAAARREVRVVVMAGAGKMFCAGADVAWMSRTVTYSEEENLRDAAAMSHMFAAIDGLPLPVVGRIQGAALGGGAGLAAVCDVVVAADDAVFGFTPFALAKIGRSAARELFLTGARFSAARAKEIGLVHAVVPAAELDAAIDGYLKELLTAGPEAVAAAKALIPAVWPRSVADAAAITAAAIAKRRVSAEGQEGLSAFLEKRPPGWAGGKA